MFGRLLSLSNKVPKVINRPKGENSPIPVTLIVPCKLAFFQRWQSLEKRVHAVHPQGDQIGRNFAYWMLVFFATFFLKITKLAQQFVELFTQQK
jgi:hypothetical protein